MESDETTSPGITEAGDELGQQIANVWGGVLTQLTAQGATRDELLRVSAGVCVNVLSLTSDAMWPDKDAPVPTAEIGASVILSRTVAQLREFVES